MTDNRQDMQTQGSSGDVGGGLAQDVRRKAVEAYDSARDGAGQAAWISPPMSDSARRW